MAGMLAMTVGCGGSGAPSGPEPVGAAAEALTGDAPDLVIAGVSGPASAVPVSYFTTSVTVCNQGTAVSAGTEVEVSLSEDDLITPWDAFSGHAPLGSLGPGQCAAVDVPTVATVPDGAYTLFAVVDPLDEVIEVLETNNAAAGGSIGIGDGPDLIVSTVSGPPSALPGGGFDVEVTVCNQGTTSSPTPTVEVLLSPDAAIEPSDPPLGGAPVPSLDPGQCGSVTVPVSAGVAEGVHHLGAVAHENGWNEELDTSNNTRAGGLLGVGHQADLVVSAVIGPPSLVVGGGLEASITVCNQGTQPSDGAAIDLLLSPEGEITPADFSIGWGHVPSLSPGQCASATIAASAYVPEGPYTLGAIVDPDSWVPELIEANNASAGGEIGVGDQPDLIASAVSAPPSATPFALFDASVTVCNQGTQPSQGTHVELRLSSDATVTATDFPAGGGPAPYLDPGQCATVTIPASADVPLGAYHLGAIADAGNAVFELIEGNNAAALAVIGVGHRPDLIVSAVSAPPSAAPGSGFDATVTVCNQGTTRPGHGAHVDLRWSRDSTITWTDAPAGGGPAPPLDPGQCADVNLPATVNVPDGAHHLGAIVDAHNGHEELNEANNAASSAPLGVGHRPDLIVSAVSGPPSLVPGSAFSASVTVCNQGTTPSHGSSVDVVLSADPAITPLDALAGSGPVADLSPGQCATVAVPASAYVPDGAYRLGAIVDPVGSLAELIETNNAAPGSVIGAGHQPDLIVSAVSGPPSLLPGGSFDAEVTVCNQGTQPSYGAHVELRLSEDATVTAADVLAGGGPVPHLDAGQCATVTLPASAYAPDGAYHLGAIVDPHGWAPELVETNNAGAGDLIGIGSWPDLIVSAVSGPPSALPGSTFDASVTVCNQGTTPGQAMVELRVSADATITATDALAGGAPTPYLDPGQCAAIAIPASLYVPEGAYRLGAIVDPHGWQPELNETNNVTSGGLIGAGSGPDLIVAAVSGPPSVLPGGGFDAEVTVCNQGTTPSYGIDLALLLSDDGALAPPDIPAGNGHVPGLGPGQCAAVTVPASAHVSEGAYRLGAIVDPGGSLAELIEANNAAPGSVIVAGSQPDLIVSAVSGPPSLLPGGSFDVEVTVCNQGTQPSYGAHVELRLSADATVTAADVPAGGGPVPYLDAGQCTAVTFPASAYAPDGAYHLGAIVDPHGWIPELVESNNAAAGDRIGVGHGPDLIVSAVSGPASLPSDSPFDASITVCNQGTSPSYGFSVEVRLSADAAIVTSDVMAGVAWLPGLDVGACEGLVVPAFAHVPAGTYTLGAIVDALGGVAELVESNNAAAGGELLVTYD
ncbi:CARDB domain-containing protein [Sorangium sp. So ce861]|uniref:CARDB domain-containing protein n=1 Tax=Sorangium sp. So ce861 TaxID=3133323 RepID=UPI003F640360